MKTKRTFTFYLDDYIKKILIKHSDRERRSMSNMIETMILEYDNKIKEKKHGNIKME